MPCDAVYDVTLDLGQTNFDVLVEAVQELEELDKKSLKVDKESKTIQFKWKYGDVYIDQKRGRVRVDRDQEESVRIIKTQYLKTGVKIMAKKWGWMEQKNPMKNKQGKQLFVKR